MLIQTRLFQLLLATSALTWASAAAAQAPAEGSVAAIEEVIVTAQKRAENVQDVPISIMAFSGSALEKANVRSVEGLTRVAPGLQFDTGLSAGKARFVVRGIGSAGGTAVEPSVATFLDGIYVPREGATIGAYLDIAGVEVLRGPQGTLFGRNASVGAINLSSNAPTDDVAASLKAEAGTGARYRVEGMANLPINERAALRVAAAGELFGGYYRNQLDGKRLGGVDSFMTRVSGKFEPTDELTVTIRGNYAKRDGDGFANYALLGDTIPPSVRATFLGLFTAIGGELDLEPFDRKVNQFSADSLDDRQWGVSSSIDYAAPNGYVVRLLSGYSDWKSEQVGTPAFGATVPIFKQIIGWRSMGQSQELQLISPQDQLLGGRLDFVGGLYFSHEQYNTAEAHNFATGMCRLVFRNLPAPLQASCLANVNNNAFEQRFRQSTTSYAVYGQANFALTSSLDLVLGGRWTKDEKDGRIVQLPTLIGSVVAANEDTRLSLTNDRATWRAGLNYRATDDVLIFASYATGYKSGGFNNQTAPADALGPLAQRRIFRPETVEQLEMGAKSEWLGRRLSVNATIYQMKVDDFQDRAYNGLNFSLRNSGDIRNRGVEVETILRPAQGLRIDASVAYLDSEFTRAEPASNLPGLPGLQDITGKRPTFTPKWQGHLGAEYGGPLGGSGLSFLVRSDLSFVSDNNIGTINDANPATVQKGFELLSARATIYGPDERWSVYAFANNIFDKGYCTSLAYQPFGGLIGSIGPNGTATLRCNTVAPPRTVAVGATFRY